MYIGLYYIHMVMKITDVIVVCSCARLLFIYINGLSDGQCWSSTSTVTVPVQLGYQELYQCWSKMPNRAGQGHQQHTSPFFSFFYKHQATTGNNQKLDTKPPGSSKLGFFYIPAVIGTMNLVQQVTKRDDVWFVFFRSTSFKMAFFFLLTGFFLNIIKPRCNNNNNSGKFHSKESRIDSGFDNSSVNLINETDKVSTLQV